MEKMRVLNTFYDTCHITIIRTFILHASKLLNEGRAK